MKTYFVIFIILSFLLLSNSLLNFLPCNNVTNDNAKVENDDQIVMKTLGGIYSTLFIISIGLFYYFYFYLLPTDSNVNIYILIYFLVIFFISSISSALKLSIDLRKKTCLSFNFDYIILFFMLPYIPKFMQIVFNAIKKNGQ
jgi:hypothetical protein